VDQSKQSPLHRVSLDGFTRHQQRGKLLQHLDQARLSLDSLCKFGGYSHGFPFALLQGLLLLRKRRILQPKGPVNGMYSSSRLVTFSFLSLRWDLAQELLRGQVAEAW